MKKKVRKWLVIAAVLAMIFAGAEIRRSVQANVSEPVSANVIAGIGGHQDGVFHLDIVVWELLMIGGGYLIWAAVSWEDRKEQNYRKAEKNGYVTQE